MNKLASMMARAIAEKATEKLAKTLYHGGPKKVDVLEPKNLHGDPDVDAVVFASPKKEFALAYSGKKWGDKDINQSITGPKNDRKMTLTEMRPGALEDIYGGVKGYLYEVPDDKFEVIPTRRGSAYEVISTEPVKPTKTIEVDNILTALERLKNVKLEEYNPKGKSYRRAVARMKNRVDSFDKKKAKGYVKWVSTTNSELGKILKDYIKS
jgi:hypothetical protein